MGTLIAILVTVTVAFWAGKRFQRSQCGCRYDRDTGNYYGGNTGKGSDLEEN